MRSDLTTLAAMAVTGSALTLLPTPVLASELYGLWKTDDGKAVVVFAPCGNGVTCGHITRILVPEPVGGARDIRNGNPALRDRRLAGLSIFTELRSVGKAWKGKGYSPEVGRNYTATITHGSNRLSVRGCVGMFCRTSTMTRMP